MLKLTLRFIYQKAKKFMLFNKQISLSRCPLDLKYFILTSANPSSDFIFYQTAPVTEKYRCRHA